MSSVSLSRIAKFSFAALALGMAAVSGYGAGALGVWGKPPQSPFLLSFVPVGPPHDEAVQEGFSTRLRARFPIGSSEADLIHETWLEGFRPITNFAGRERIVAFQEQGS